MTLPGDLNTVTVTGEFLDAAGTPQAGTVTFTPSAEVTDATGMVVIPPVPRTYVLLKGLLSAGPLAATDNADLSPAWTYEICVSLADAPEFSFSCAIPHTPSPVDLSALL